MNQIQPDVIRIHPQNQQMDNLNNQFRDMNVNDQHRRFSLNLKKEPEYVNKECPHCKQQTKLNIKQERVSHSFYMEDKCKKCNKDIFYFTCACKHIFISKEKFLQGTKYKCPNQQCEVKEIQLFRCGKQDCKAINMYPGTYRMGEFLSCCQCQTSFQQVCCPICAKNMYFLSNAPYKPAQLIQCYNCQNKFEHYNCLTCCNPLYSKYQQFKTLDRDMCDNCNQGCYKISCPKCSLPNFRLHFHPYKYDQCGYCQEYFQFFDCPSCKKSNKIATQYKGMDYGNKQCQHCHYKFSILECLKCKSQLLQNNIKEKEMFDNEKLKISCKYCQQDQLGVTCHKCNSTFGVQDLLANDVKCETCNSITSLKNGSNNQKAHIQLSQINLEKKVSENKNNDSEEDERFLCKICFSVNANHIFTKCGHLVSCDDCTSALKGKCPLCRVQSNSQKIFI